VLEMDCELWLSHKIANALGDGNFVRERNS
jgi:hypothetical protein